MVLPVHLRLERGGDGRAAGHGGPRHWLPAIWRLRLRSRVRLTHRGDEPVRADPRGARPAEVHLPEGLDAALDEALRPGEQGQASRAPDAPGVRCLRLLLRQARGAPGHREHGHGRRVGLAADEPFRKDAGPSHADDEQEVREARRPHGRRHGADRQQLRAPHRGPEHQRGLAPEQQQAKMGTRHTEPGGGLQPGIRPSTRAC
mmetsp:Transcript_7073/g.19700  ORF Transcript_7073/g.19700 Transcript_7073/m.19700 type:complete len:203 (+) Transcript_7073:1953-2561(+)